MMIPINAIVEILKQALDFTNNVVSKFDDEKYARAVNELWNRLTLKQKAIFIAVIVAIALVIITAALLMSMISETSTDVTDCSVREGADVVFPAPIAAASAEVRVRILHPLFLRRLMIPFSP